MASISKQPRIRVNRTASLALSTTWQRIDFNGTSQYNVNTFGKDPVSGNQMITWNAVDKLFRFYNKIDTNYLMFLNVTTTVTAVATPASLRLRFVIPNGISPGVPNYFPFPEEGGYIDIGAVTLLAIGMSTKMAIPIPLYLENSIRANGIGVEMCISNSLLLLGVCTLNNATLLIQSTK